MTNIVQIIKLANAGSLCLIDELGAGTDPVEGAALAIAILERLRDKHAKIASTTHYAELKEFALRTPGVENGSCEFDVATPRDTFCQPKYMTATKVLSMKNATMPSMASGAPKMSPTNHE